MVAKTFRGAACCLCSVSTYSMSNCANGTALPVAVAKASTLTADGNSVSYGGLKTISYAVVRDPRTAVNVASSSSLGAAAPPSTPAIAVSKGALMGCVVSFALYVLSIVSISFQYSTSSSPSRLAYAPN